MNRAVRQFNELLLSSIPTSEEKTLLRIKIDRLSAGGVGSSVRRVEMSREAFYPGFPLAIVPLNYAPPEVPLRDICLLLESKWLVGCEVLPSLWLDEEKILDRKRHQFTGDRILDELRKVYRVATRRYGLVVALVGRDLFGTGTNEVDAADRLIDESDKNSDNLR